MKNYRDRAEAASALLADAVQAVGDLIPFVVVGGWSPFLLFDHGGKHPGTLDVDLLFEGSHEPESLKDVLHRFLESGFIRSAKHDFQLLKPMIIGGREFVFNVDFLHPCESNQNFNLFVKQVEWPEYTDASRRKHFAAKSIALPSSQLIFDYVLHVDYKHCVNSSATRIRLIDAVGVLLTKAGSFQNPKRPRDSYDLLLGARHISSNGEAMSKLVNLRKSSDEADALFLTMKNNVDINNQLFDRNVQKYDSSISKSSHKIIEILETTER